MQKLFSSLPFRVITAIISAVVYATFIPADGLRIFYTTSFIIKELLEFTLPFIVFFFISNGVVAFRKNSIAMIILLLGSVFASNGLTSLYTYGVGGLFLGTIGQQKLLCSTQAASVIEPYYSLGLSPLIRSEQAMIAALLIGVFLTFVSLPSVRRFLEVGKRGIEWGMNELFIPILPLYVFGFFLKMVHELPVWELCSLYGMVFLLAIGMQLFYLAAAYFVAVGMRLADAIKAITIAAPSYLTALGTMSSVATLPVSVVCAEKNSGNRSLSQFAMPILANIHLMGDAVCVPLFCIATMKAFMGVLPAFGTYIVFIGYFCLTMLAVSGIPGGGIIVMLPLLKSLFGFTPEMLSVMTALYLLQDGFGTAANVMGDGALVLLLNRLSRALRIQSDPSKGS